MSSTCRDEKDERFDQIAYQRKAQNWEKKRKILASVYKEKNVDDVDADVKRAKLMVNDEQPVVAEKASGEEQQAKKRRKRKKKAKESSEGHFT